MSDNQTQVVDINDKLFYSLSQLSTAFGPARETISKRLKSANVAPARKRGGHDVYHIGAASRAILADEINLNKDVNDPDTWPAKERLDYYRGNTEKRKDMLESGLLVPVEEVTAELSMVVKICTRTLDTIADNLEMKCGLSSSEVQIVEAECDNARYELAEKLAE